MFIASRGTKAAHIHCLLVSEFGVEVMGRSVKKDGGEESTDQRREERLSRLALSFRRPVTMCDQAYDKLHFVTSTLR